VDGHHYTLFLKSTGAKTSSRARLGSLFEGFLPVSELQQADAEKSNVHKPQGGGCYTDTHGLGFSPRVSAADQGPRVHLNRVMPTEQPSFLISGGLGHTMPRAQGSSCRAM
jgi:hypothetical protein